MGYVHVEIETAQQAKRAGHTCGDVVGWQRDASAATMVCSDGLGSGIRAHLAAQMCVARILELLQQGRSVREAFAAVVRTMNQARGTDMPYAVFTVVRILNDGVATVLSYEMPPPLFISPRHASVLPQRTVTVEQAIIGESNCHVEPGEGLLVFSDGITQAGLGAGFPEGWGIQGAAQYVSDCLADRIPVREIPSVVLRRAQEIWGARLGDDCTAAMASCRIGEVVNILTGPPCVPEKDRTAVNEFLLTRGAKVVCGGTTAQIVAQVLETRVEMEADPTSFIAPPSYRIQGIDLVTEGAVTLNQVYNLLDEDLGKVRDTSAVIELCALLTVADRVNIFVGNARNPAGQDMAFRQQGILSRQTIIPLIAEKLRAKGKLVVVKQL